MADYYAILGIDPTATSGQIKVAYRRLALRFHPDKNPGNALASRKFIEINEAYEVLNDPERKRWYDFGLSPNIDEIVEEDPRKRRPPPVFYYQYHGEKTTYGTRAYALATVSVIVIILLAVAFPIYLLQSTSTKYYNQALDYYFAGRYYSALHHIDLSIQDISSNNAEACALASVILVHKLHKYQYAMKYIEKGLGYHPVDSLASEFHYLEGISLANIQQPEKALCAFAKVKQYSHTYDSSLFKAALILTYTLPNLDSAAAMFDQLISRNNAHLPAKYYKGIVYEKKDQHENAYGVFEALVGSDFNQAAALYHLARAEIKLNMLDSACAHLKIASSYHLAEARQLKDLYCGKESIFKSPYK
ncbi:MAG: DnaJ domain-containing protein [Cyclobacteriaceae bacterium]|nr:DnaJ domain-containing protein [Cyclobacteriaceae bacterium]